MGLRQKMSLAVNVSCCGDCTSPSGLRGFVDQARVTEADADRWVCVEMAFVAFQLFGMPEIVGVDEGDEWSGGVANARVACAGEPAIFLRDDADARVIEGRDDGRAVVGGGIVDDDDFEVGICLLQDRAHRFADGARRNCRAGRRLISRASQASCTTAGVGDGGRAGCAGNSMCATTASTDRGRSHTMRGAVLSARDR